VERYRGDIRADAEVDALIGTNELDASWPPAKGIDAPANAIEPYLYSRSHPAAFWHTSPYATSKIAEGCDHPCTSVSVPHYRGAFSQPPFESVINEARGSSGRYSRIN